MSPIECKNLVEIDDVQNDSQVNFHRTNVGLDVCKDEVEKKEGKRNAKNQEKKKYHLPIK